MTGFLATAERGFPFKVATAGYIPEAGRGQRVDARDPGQVLASFATGTAMDGPSNPNLTFPAGASSPRSGTRIGATAAFGAGPLLLISPHFDDVVLSCEAIIGGDQAVDILNVFTSAPAEGMLSEWDRRCGFAAPGEAMEARAREDSAALSGTAHRRHELGLLESTYAPDGRSQAEAAILTEWVDRWLARMPGPALVGLPAGAGAQPRPPGLAQGAAWLTGALWRRGRRMMAPRRPGGARMHIDHCWVRDVLALHLAGKGMPFLLYEELPYLWARRGDAAVAGLVRSLSARAQRHEFPVDRAAKARRVASYASQLPQLDPHLRPTDLAATLPRTERYWRVTPPAAR